MRAFYRAIVGILLVAGCSSEGGSSSSSGGSGTSSTSSSSGSSGQCADCGPCGIAGPMTTDGLLTPDYGVDAAGVAAVGVDVYAAGECKGQSNKRFLLRYASGAVTLKARGADEKLVTTVVSTTTGSGFVWSDRDLKMDLTRPSPTTLVFVFEEGDGGSITSTCTLTAGTLSCK